jgi:hypothetical protein
LKRVPKLGNLLTRQDDARAEASALKRAVKIFNVIKKLLNLLK